MSKQDVTRPARSVSLEELEEMARRGVVDETALYMPPREELEQEISAARAALAKPRPKCSRPTKEPHTPARKARRG